MANLNKRKNGFFKLLLNKRILVLGKAKLNKLKCVPFCVMVGIEKPKYCIAVDVLE